MTKQGYNGLLIFTIVYTICVIVWTIVNWNNIGV